MVDRDLRHLKELEIPAPSQGAKERAIRAAVTVFEKSEEEKSAGTQGNSNLVRLTATFMKNTWEWFMDRRMIAGTVAAALIVMPFAGLYVWQHTNWFEKHDGLGGVFSTFSGQRSRGLSETESDGTIKLSKAEERGQEGSPSGQTGQHNLPGLKKPGADVGIALDALSDTAAPAANEPKVKVTTPSSARPVARSKNVAGAPSALPQVLQRRVQIPPSAGLGAVSGYQGLGGIRDSVVARQELNRDQFSEITLNPVKSVREAPVSTFSVDVDTASYAFVRRMLMRGELPPEDSVRVEEMINYFNYNYPRPDTAEVPFKTTVAVYPTPWNPNTKLLHIGIKGHEIVPASKPRSNLVFLLDVSGSMNSPDKLPLLKSAFRLLVDRLEDEDSVAIVTYAGQAGTVLEPTPVKEKHKILAALDKLRSGGSTAGAQGIQQAYALAESNFDKNGINRVILATDGDFNVGITDRDELKRYIEKKRKSGIFLSVLGFGQGNYNDALMQALAQNGNGNASYIDNLNEARKVLVDESSSTLFPIAKDVKIQIEFNPEKVSEYRLIGYETRKLNREDFNNDKVDAGDIGSGHTVTAIYEITPADSSVKLIDDLRYRDKEEPSTSPVSGEYAFLKLRYKLPNEDVSKLIRLPITSEFEKPAVGALSEDLRFAASVAAFGQKLRGETFLADFSYDQILSIGAGARGADQFGYRSEFLNLVRLAKSLENSNR